MGRLFVPRIRNAGFRLTIFDVFSEALSRVAGPGITVAGSPAEVAGNADVVLMSLPGPKQVEEVVVGPQGLLNTARPETILVDMSTVDPGPLQRIGEENRRRRI
jgi:2-hydroxy-3-oxopropionate reductase